MHCDFRLCCVALAALFAPAAQAQQFPSKPISFVIPYQPGGNVDVAARIVQKAIGDGLGQPILVENKPGGAAMLAGDYVARSEPDGHTLLVGSNGPVVYGSLTLPKPAVPLGAGLCPSRLDLVVGHCARGPADA